MVILVREEGYHKRIFFSVWASVLTCALLGVLVYNELLLPFSIRQGRDCLTIFFTERCRVVVACAVGDCLCRNVGSTLRSDSSPWGWVCGRGLLCVLTVEFHPGEPPNKTAAFICESTFFDVASRLRFTVHRDVAFILFC